MQFCTKKGYFWCKSATFINPLFIVYIMDEGILEKGLIIGANIVETNAKKYQKQRYLYPAVNNAIKNRNIISILMGLRGTGKTVLLSQLITGKKYSYLQMDYAPLKNLNLYDILQYLHKVKGSEIIVLDEFQDSMDFSSIKAFFEETKGQVSLLISGSSAIALYPNELIRRVNKLVLEPLSFREYLYFKRGIEKPVLSINEIIEDKYRDILVYAPLIKEYMAEALPYMLETEANIIELIDKIIRYDLMVFRKLNYENVREVEKILLTLAFAKGQTSFNALSNKTGIEKTQVMRYIALLKEALLIKDITASGSLNRTILKEQKIYLTPPFRYGICKELRVETDIGTLREEFFIQHTYEHGPRYIYGKGMPDFLVKGKRFEIGGPAKHWEQKPDYLVVDDKVPGKGELPLVAFGFTY